MAPAIDRSARPRASGTLFGSSLPDTRGGNSTGQPRRLTGRAVLVWLLAFFGVVIAVNGLMAKLAIDTMPGTATASSYEAGSVYNAEIAAARNQAARQWQVLGHVERSPDGRAFVEVEARDGEGRPVNGLAFSAALERPIDGRADRSLTLVERGGGRYRGEAAELAPGQWELVLEADRGAERMFMSRNRIVLK